MPSFAMLKKVCSLIFFTLAMFVPPATADYSLGFTSYYGSGTSYGSCSSYSFAGSDDHQQHWSASICATAPVYGYLSWSHCTGSNYGTDCSYTCGGQDAFHLLGFNLPSTTSLSCTSRCLNGTFSPAVCSDASTKNTYSIPNTCGSYSSDDSHFGLILND